MMKVEQDILFREAIVRLKASKSFGKEKVTNFKELIHKMMVDLQILSTLNLPSFLLRFLRMKMVKRENGFFCTNKIIYLKISLSGIFISLFYLNLFPINKALLVNSFNLKYHLLNC